MQSWAIKRRLIYGGSVLLFLALVFGLGYFKFFYVAPTCSDGRQNGDEIGIDCGGSCKSICKSDALTPITLWSKVFNITGDVYTAVAYVQNPNLTTKNPKAQYKFKIYDSNGGIIKEIVGETSIPKNKKFAVFETNILSKDRKPKSADFEFTAFSAWVKDTEAEPDLNVTYSTLMSTTTSPRITGTLQNLSLKSIDKIELDVFVLDSKENVVAAGRTFIDSLLKGTSQDFIFTWPKPFNLGVEECLNPLDVVLALDKSGSMRSESANPPEPFTTVLSTAEGFVKNLTDSDQVSVVSFGTNANKENALAQDKNISTQSVKNLTLSTSTENTNITGGLTWALEELNSDRARSDSKKAIVLLTDGIPTEPKQAGVPDYPSISAQKLAEDIKKLGVEIFTIGLGKNVSEGFLKTISTDDNHYFYAPTKETLSGIYSKIGTGLCPKKPNVITITYKVI